MNLIEVFENVDYFDFTLETYIFPLNVQIRG
jgi:hypothetical protein